MKRSSFFPLALITVGTLLLLNQFELIEFTRPFFLIIGSAMLGLILTRKAFLNPARNGLLGGSFFILLSGAFLMLNLGYIPYYDYMFFPMVLVPLGLANLIFYLFNRKSFTNVTFGVIFLLASLPVLFYHYGYISFWQISETISTYWPVLLITAGLGFLLEGVWKKAK